MLFARSFERPPFLEPLGQEKQRHGDQQNAHGNGGAKGPIICGTEKALHKATEVS
jgi:hypothetical protein